MVEWYYSKNGERLGPVSEMEIQQLLQSSEISGTSLVWSEGMADWLPASEVFAAVLNNLPETAICAVSGESLPVSDMLQYGDHFVAPQHKDTLVQKLHSGENLNRYQADNSLYRFADPSKRAKITKVLFWICCVLQFPLLGMVYLLTKDPENTNLGVALIAVVAGLGVMALSITGIVFYCMWIYRACANSQLNGPGHDITPGWAVGWYFIPVMSIFMPFQVMCKIWHRSFGNDPSASATPPVIGWWWAVWIICGINGGVGSFFEQMGRPGISIVCDWIGAALYIVATILITKIITVITDAQVKNG